MTPSAPNVDLQAPFPKSASALPYWRANLHHLTTTALPQSFRRDVKFFSSELATLAQRQPTTFSKMTLVRHLPFYWKARQACSGATGRNGGYLRPEVYFNMLPYMASHGVHAAVEISKFEIAHIQAFKELIEKEHIDCDFTLTRTFNVFLDEEQVQRSKAVYDRLVTVGLEGLSDVHYTGPKNAEAVCGVKDAKARRL